MARKNIKTRRYSDADQREAERDRNRQRRGNQKTKRPVVKGETRKGDWR